MARGKREKPKKENENDVESQAMAVTRDEGFWKEMWNQARLVWYLIRDPEVPLYLKILPLAALIYILIPTDFIPDVFPVVGQLDDLTALIVGGKVFIELAPQRVVAQYIRSRQSSSQNLSHESAGDEPPAGGVIIEGQFEEIEPDENDQAA